MSRCGQKWNLKYGIIISTFNETCYISIANCSEFELYLQILQGGNLIPLEPNWSIFTCFTPTESKSWPLTFSWIDMKWYVTVKFKFFLTRYSKRNLLVGFWQTLKQFWTWHLYKLFCYPEPFCILCYPAAIANFDSWPHTKPCEPFRLSKSS